MQVRKQQLELDMEQQLVPNQERSTSVQLLSRVQLFVAPWNAAYIMRNAGLDEEQAGIKTAGRNINNIRYADDTFLVVKSKEELETLLMKVKEESGKAGLKLNIQKTIIMASGPIS